MHPIRICLLTAAAAAAPLAGQGAASATYIATQPALAGGGGAQTSQYVVQASFGPAPVIALAFSTTYGLAAGSVGGLAVPIGGTPHLTGVEPRFASMRSLAALTVHGTGLIHGTAPTLSIGGVPAAIGARSNADVQTTLPLQPAPGWQPVTFQSSGSTTTLARGIGVLPMIDMEPAMGIGAPTDLVYRGRPGDLMLWCLAGSTIPPLPLAGLGHGLALNPATMVNTSVFFVGAPDGVLRVRVPALLQVTTLYLQGVTLSGDPGYAPGAFTNVMRVF